MAKLTAVSIKNAKEGRLHDGGGLFLDRTANGGRWTFRYQHLGKRRDMGLGSYPSVSLSSARQERDRWKLVLARGDDPISVRRQADSEARDALDRTDPTFEDMAKIAFEARKAKLRGGGERGRWFSPLRVHVIPKIGSKRMSQIHQTHIRDAIAPIWRTMHPTAKKAIERTRKVFETARLSGVDCDPFTVDAAQHLLGEVNHIAKPLEALTWQEAPAVYAKLGEHTSHLILRFIMLTAVRWDAAQGARLREIADGIWTVPAERVKGTEGKVSDFRVPLSAEALNVVDIASQYSPDYLFTGQTGRKSVSDVAATKALRIHAPGATIHGLRTTFRTWAQDHDVAWDVAETILGHTIGGKVERSYARSDLLDRRRPVMEAWAQFLKGAEAQNVVRMFRD